MDEERRDRLGRVAHRAWLAFNGAEENDYLGWDRILGNGRELYRTMAQAVAEAVDAEHAEEMARLRSQLANLQRRFDEVDGVARWNRLGPYNHPA